MVLANRYLVGKQYFDCKEKLAIVFIQALIAVGVLECTKLLQWITYEPFSLSVAKKWTPMVVFFSCMLYSGTQASACLPIHIVVVFKNVTNIAIVVGEWLIFHERVTRWVVVSLIIMLLGALMATLSDTSPSLYSSRTTLHGNDDTWEMEEALVLRRMAGYIWMVLNCAATAIYVLYMRYMTTFSDLKLSKFGMARYNNLCTAVLLFPLLVLNGELNSLVFSEDAPLFHTPSFGLLLVVSGAVGIGLNLSSFWCVSVTSATTYATIGALNKLPTTFLGVLLLHETLTFATGCYVAFGMTGGILYGWAKFIQSQASKRLQTTLEPVSSVTSASPSPTSIRCTSPSKKKKTLSF